jgi:hypothetical protein
MNDRAATTIASTRSHPEPAVTPARNGLLQRRCSCGGTPGPDGECAACRAKRLLGQEGLSIQPKLAVNRPGDQYEQEADQIAEAVMRVPDTVAQRQIEPEEETLRARPLLGQIFPVIQRQAEDEEKEEEAQGFEEESLTPRRTEEEKKEEELLQAKPVADHLRWPIQRQLEEDQERLQIAGKLSNIAPPREVEATTPDERAGSDFQARLDVEKSGGHRIASPVRQFMEARFGVDFGQVRIHADERSAALAADIQAQAFTIGNDIYFGAGYYDPSSTAGRQLLAHELVHTLQQNPGQRRQRAARGRLATDPSEPHGAVAESSGSTPGVLPIAAPFIQRTQAFVPKRRPSGPKVHSEILPAFGNANPELFTEVKIPGAKKFVIEEGKAGVADFYIASTTIAVNLDDGEPKYQKPDNKLQKGGKTWTTEHEKQGAPIGPKPDSKGCDGSTGSERICRLDKAPGTILLGDLKPGASAEAILGEGQLRDYKGGLRNTSTTINAYIIANPSLVHPKSTLWNPFTDTIKTLKIPPKYDFPTATTPMEDLGLYVPGRKTSDPIPGLRGRKVVYKDKVDGVWVYEWIPPTVPASLKKAAIAKEFIDALARVEKLIDKLRSAPTSAAPKRLSRQDARRQNADLQRTTPRRIVVRSAAPRLIQRQKKGFDHPTWQAEYKEWRKGTEKLLESEKGRNPRVIATLMEVKRRSMLPIDVPESFTRIAKEVSKLEHWVQWGGVYGRLRRVFGNLFTKVSDLYRRARDRFRALTKRKSTDPSGGDSLVKAIIRVAFRTAQGFLTLTIDRVADHLKTALEKGAGVLVNEFFGEENVEKLASARTDLEKMVTDVEGAARQKVEAVIEEMIAPYQKELDFIADVGKWLGDIGKIVNTIRWIVRAVNCATPPGVGCLKILLQAAAEEVLERAVGSCWFQQNVVVPAFKKVTFFQDLPGKISGYIIEQIKRLLPLDESLKAKLFPSTVPPSGEIKEGDIPCDEDAVTPEKIAMARLREEHGEEKVRLLIAMMEKMGVGDEQELKLDHIQQMDQILSDVPQADIEAALRNYDRSKAFGVVGMDKLAQSIRATAAGTQAAGPAPEEAAPEGGPVVSADKAKFDGTSVGSLNRTRIKVEKPLWEHVKGSEPLVNLVGYVDKKWVRTITDVPTRVTKRLWKPSEARKDYLAIYYRLKQGVRFVHDVPDVPPFVLAEGDEVPGGLKPTRAPRRDAGSKEREAGAEQ